MGKTALIFTGQGSQIVGMGKDFYNSFSSSKNVFDTFDDILGRKISDIAFEGDDDNLKLTVNSQPCILATEIAIFEALMSKVQLDVAYVAGHSLGEYAAMYAANVFSLDVAAKLIQARAETMANAGSGAMSAIIGLSEEVLNAVLEEASVYGYVDVANYNTPEQTVITGESGAVQKANEIATEKGAKRVIPLAVSGAFHSKLMQEAASIFNSSVIAVNLNDADIPVITNVDALPTLKASDFREKMTKQIYSSVQWVKTLLFLYNHGVDNFVEIGPSKILTGMVRKTLQNVTFSAVCNLNDFEKFVSQYKTIV